MAPGSRDAPDGEIADHLQAERHHRHDPKARISNAPSVVRSITGPS
jgi:hypothetical protein